jgi:hypothetical protein
MLSEPLGKLVNLITSEERVSGEGSSMLQGEQLGAGVKREVVQVGGGLEPNMTVCEQLMRVQQVSPVLTDLHGRMKHISLPAPDPD